MRRKNKNFFKRIGRNSQSFEGRISFIHFLFIVLFLFLGYKLFNIQIKDNLEFVNQAEALHDTTTILPPDRGSIYFQDKNKEYIPVAINKRYNSLYAIPKDIEKPEETSKFLFEIIPSSYGLSYDQIFSRLNKINDPYEPLIKKVEDDDLIDNIQNAQIKGIYLGEDSYRYYPLGSSAAQVIGFVGEADDGLIKGRYGLESYYNTILSGKKGIFMGIKDALGRLVRSNFSEEEKTIEGLSIETTIDKNIQFATDRILADLMKYREASKGTIIVMEVKTGRILALANMPTFNLNDFSEIKDYSIFRNFATEERYEPGSVIKPFTMAAGIDTGKVTPDTTYIDKGYYDIGGFHVVNYRNEVYGKSTMRNVLEHSINTGAIFVSEQVGSENLRKYFRKFGFADTTGVDLPLEISGDLSNLEYPKVNPTYSATASYGVGISVTPMELIKAYTAIANKGRMVTPYLIESTRDRAGNRTTLISTESLSDLPQVIKQETAETLTSMLVGVIENGFGKNAKVKGYSLAGKTGTSFVVLEDKKGYSEDVTHTFVGFFPASNPKYIILVKMDKPQWGKEAASYTVTLAFKEVKQFLINYYNVPPDEL
jgi:cell division protein FtsI/penicillin-binding protein 2